MENLISIGKITNFFGIQGEAKVGYTNASTLEKAKKVFVKNVELNVVKLRFHKNIAIVKFKEINDINELMPYKGENIYIEKKSVKENLTKEEYLVDDLVGMNVFDDKDDLIGTIETVEATGGNDILSVKCANEEYKNILIPFVKELVPIVDMKNKKVIIKPIKGLLPWD